MGVCCVAGVEEFGVSGCWRARILTRGKRWRAEDERMLEELVKAGLPAAEIAKSLRKTVAAVHNKVSHLGLEDDNRACSVPSSLSSLSSSSSSSLSSPIAEVEKPSVAKVLPAESEEPEKPLPESSAPFLVWPEALDSPEDAMRTVAAAVLALQRPGLGRNEISRLKCIIMGAQKFQGLYDWAAQSRRLEERLVELEGKYFELVKKQTTAQKDESS